MAVKSPGFTATTGPQPALPKPVSPDQSAAICTDFPLHSALCPTCTAALASAENVSVKEVFKALHALCGEGRALFFASLTPCAVDMVRSALVVETRVGAVS